MGEIILGKIILFSDSRNITEEAIKRYMKEQYEESKEDTRK